MVLHVTYLRCTVRGICMLFSSVKLLGSRVELSGLHHLPSSFSSIFSCAVSHLPPPPPPPPPPSFSFFFFLSLLLPSLSLCLSLSLSLFLFLCLSLSPLSLSLFLCLSLSSLSLPLFLSFSLCWFSETWRWGSISVVFWSLCNMDPLPSV